MSEKPQADTPTGPWWWIRQVLSWTALFLLLAVLFAAVVVPRIAGAVPYTVLTSSMEPTYPPGTLIVVRPVDQAALAIGTPITYQIESGKPEVVTHRIIGIEYNGRGERTFITQGDANNAPDTRPVRPVQVRGEVWYSVPYIGHVNLWVNGGQRTLLVFGAAGLLLVYAGWMFVSAGRDKRRTRAQPVDEGART